VRELLKDAQARIFVHCGDDDLYERITKALDSDRARPLNEWSDDHGSVVWWAPPVREPSWIGTPSDSDWPGYHTHWTPHPKVPENIKEHI
jgi:hypothetical protein